MLFANLSVLYDYIDIDFKFIGDCLAVSIVGGRSKITFKLLIWNWKSGRLVVVGFTTVMFNF